MKWVNSLNVEPHSEPGQTFNPLSATPQNGQTLKQFVGSLLTDCLIVFGYFVRLALEGLRLSSLGKNNS